MAYSEYRSISFAASILHRVKYTFGEYAVYFYYFIQISSIDTQIHAYLIYVYIIHIIITDIRERGG